MFELKGVLHLVFLTTYIILIRPFGGADHLVPYSSPNCRKTVQPTGGPLNEAYLNRENRGPRVRWRLRNYE